eukprot:gene27371-biopygen10418
MSRGGCSRPKSSWNSLNADPARSFDSSSIPVANTLLSASKPAAIKGTRQFFCKINKYKGVTTGHMEQCVCSLQ